MAQRAPPPPLAPVEPDQSYPSEVSQRHPYSSPYVMWTRSRRHPSFPKNHPKTGHMTKLVTMTTRWIPPSWIVLGLLGSSTLTNISATAAPPPFCLPRKPHISGWWSWGGGADNGGGAERGGGSTPLLLFASGPYWQQSAQSKWMLDYWTFLWQFLCGSRIADK